MILKKLGDEYKLYSHDSCIATTHESPYKKLSLKNCEAIANGYDLEELACDKIGIDISVVNHIDNKVIENDSVSTPIHEAGALGAGLYHMVKGFEIGFQKAFELLGDKKFGEEDMKKAYLQSFKYEYFGDLIRTLQQTEWDCTFNPEEKDADGCLILKRK